MVPFLYFIIRFLLWPGQSRGTSHLLPILLFGGFVLFTQTPLDSNCLHSAGSSHLHSQGCSSESHELLDDNYTGRFPAGQMQVRWSYTSPDSQVKKRELQLSLGNLKSRHHPHREYHRRPCKRNVISRKPNLEWGNRPCQRIHMEL